MQGYTNITDIKNYTPEEIGENEYYFLDTHVWVFFLYHQDEEDNIGISKRIKNHEPQYIKFFDLLTRIHVKRLSTKFRPKVIMTSVLFTEIMHAYFVNRVMENFLEEEWETKKEFWLEVYNSNKSGKEININQFEKVSFFNWFRTARWNKNGLLKFGFPYYRTTPHFKTHFKRVSARFEQLYPFMEVGKHISFDYETMLSIVNAWGDEQAVYCDFNDYYYYYFCHKNNLKFPLVTHDSGFVFKQADIITGQKSLLDLRNKSTEVQKN